MSRVSRVLLEACWPTELAEQAIGRGTAMKRFEKPCWDDETGVRLLTSE